MSTPPTTSCDSMAKMAQPGVPAPAPVPVPGADANKQNTAALIANAIAMSLAAGGLAGVGAHGLGLMNRRRLLKQTTVPMAHLSFASPAEEEDPRKKKLGKFAADVFDRKPMWQRPVSSTLGRLNAPITAMLLGSTAPFKPGPTAEGSKELLEGLKSLETGEDPLAIYLGGGRPIEDLKRIWRRKSTGIPSKLLGTAMWPITATLPAVARADHYNPFAHSITAYHDDPAIMGHEMGHAADYGSKKYPGGRAAARMIPYANIPLVLQDEYKASWKHGLPALKAHFAKTLPPEEAAKAYAAAVRKLSGGFGSYAGAFSGVPGGPFMGSAVGQMTAHEVMKRRQAMPPGAATTDKPKAETDDKKQPDEDKAKTKKTKDKTEAKAAEWNSAGRSGYENTVGKLIYDTLLKSAPGAPPSLLKGDYAKGPWSNPATLAIGIPASLAAFYGGNKIVDKVGDKLKTNEKQQELQRVKQRYEALLKMSSAGEFDKLAVSPVGPVPAPAKPGGPLPAPVKPLAPADLPPPQPAPTPAGGWGSMPKETRTSLWEQSRPYYQNAPGGYPAAIQKAMQAQLQRPANLDMSDYPKYTPGALTKKFPVQWGVAGAEQDGIGSRDKIRMGNNALTPTSQTTLARETMRAAIPHTGLYREQESTYRNTPPDRWADRAYRPSVLDSRLAEVKRLFTQATGIHVDSPEKAEQALEWYRTKSTLRDTPGRDSNNVDLQYQDSGEKNKARMLQRMQELVRNDSGATGLQAVAKAAALSLRVPAVRPDRQGIDKLAGPGLGESLAKGFGRIGASAGKKVLEPVANAGRSMMQGMQDQAADLGQGVVEHPATGTGLGILGAWALLSSLGAGHLAYNLSSRDREKALLDKAVKQRMSTTQRMHLPAVHVSTPDEEY